LLQFFGAHVDHLAELAAPLYAVLEGMQWNKRKRKREIIRLADWEQRLGQAQKESFEKLRDVLADPLFLVPARANAKKRLCTDASKYGLGAALLQWEEERGWLPVGFAFKKVEGGRVTLHDNGKGTSCSRVWFTEVQEILIRGKVRGHHRSHRTNMIVSIAEPERKFGAMDRGDADVRL
jgi:RNase H-like domain found in reverse transcriptase